MNALGTPSKNHLGTQRLNRPEVIKDEDFTYHVYLVNGAVQKVAPATGLRISNADVIFVLGDLVVSRWPRESLYFVTRQPAGVIGCIG